MALVLDTGVLLAALDEADPAHEPCADLIEAAAERLVIPAPVLVELEYWVSRRTSLEAWLAFCEEAQAGAYSIRPLDADLLVRAARLQVRFDDLRVGLVDAAVFATCEALGERKVATLDRRHFGVLKTEQGSALELLPA